jgi:hypothetical protein
MTGTGLTSTKPSQRLALRRGTREGQLVYAQRSDQSVPPRGPPTSNSGNLKNRDDGDLDQIPLIFADLRKFPETAQLQCSMNETKPMKTSRSSPVSRYIDL